MDGIGNRMEPDATPARLSGDVARKPYDDAEVTEVQVRM
jgi:hypothetical protein